MASSVNSETTQLDTATVPVVGGKTEVDSYNVDSSSSAAKIEMENLDVERQGAPDEPVIGPRAAILLFIGYVLQPKYPTGFSLNPPLLYRCSAASQDGPIYFLGC